MFQCFLWSKNTGHVRIRPIRGWNIVKEVNGQELEIVRIRPIRGWNQRSCEELEENTNTLE